MQLKIDSKTVTDWCCFLRDLCSWDLLNNPVQLGGPGHIVAVDETCVARAKPAANHHARPVPPQWVFGAVDLQTGQFTLEMVPRRDGATLLPVIQRVIQPGSRVWSDQWQGYNGLMAAGYIHERVNHSQHFVNPITGVHTNNIEARWAACKATMKKRYGVRRHLLPGYLDEYMWRARHPRPDTLDAILDVMRRRYPV